MAITPETRYPGQSEVGNADYPLGSARNVASVNDGTGTPQDAAWMNDLWGFCQSILDEAGIAASGTPDKVGASQYLQGLKRTMLTGQVQTDTLVSFLQSQVTKGYAVVGDKFSSTFKDSSRNQGSGWPAWVLMDKVHVENDINIITISGTKYIEAVGYRGEIELAGGVISSGNASIAMQNIIDASGGAKTAITFSSGAWIMVEDVTVPQNIDLIFKEGAFIDSIESTAPVLKILGTLTASKRGIFADGVDVIFGYGIGRIYPQWFGISPNNASLKTSNYSRIRAMLKAVYSSVDELSSYVDGNNEIDWSFGKWHIDGNNPFGMTRTDFESLPGGESNRNGIKFTGAGRGNTIFVLYNSGAETWFFSNVDGNYTSANSGALNRLTIDDISFRNYAEADDPRKYKVVSASKVNMFQLESGGRESRYIMNRCEFSGFDIVEEAIGESGVSMITYNDCLFDSIKDDILHINNHESLIHRYNSCDVTRLYGNGIRIGAEGGGEITVKGGGLVELDVIYGTDNLPDLTNTEKRGFIHFDLDGMTSATVGVNSRKITVSDAHFRMFDDINMAIYGTCDTDYSSILGILTDCTMDEDYNRDASDNVITPALTTKRDVILLEGKIAGLIKLKGCTLHERFTYTIDCLSSAALPAVVTFKSCILNWNPFGETGGVYSGGLRDNCIISDRGAIAASDTIAYAKENGSNIARIGLDFDLNTHQDGVSLNVHEKIADFKSSDVVWPVSGGDVLYLYLPEGSNPTKLIIAKPEHSTHITGTRQFIVRMASGTEILDFDIGDPTDDWYAEYEMPENKSGIDPEPYLIPASPNNYITFSATGSSAAFPATDGRLYVKYL